MGGSETDPGIFINWSLGLGTTASRCITFNKFWPISRDLVFDIRILELWVVNEVFMKKRNIPKRDFYNTVVMWNRIGRHKGNDDHRRTDHRDYCFHNGINTTLTNDNHCSHEEIHETEERHFEPSSPSLIGDNSIDDELLMAIKNRLAGLPLMTSTKPQYLANRQPSKPKKVPTQVSTQVDDSMITELKSQGTSTSHVKVTSRCTQSGTGLASQMEGTAQQHSTSRMQQAHEAYQRSLPLERTTKFHRSPSSTLQSDAQYQQPLQPRRNSFPNHKKTSFQSPGAVNPHTNYADPPPKEGVIRSSMRRNSSGLPEVPDYYGMSSQRASESRGVRSSHDEAREFSWANRRNMGAVLPYQQQLVRATPSLLEDTNPNQTPNLLEDTNPNQSSLSRNILRGEGILGREVSQQTAQNNISKRSVRESDGTYQNPTQYLDRQLTSRSLREGDPYKREHDSYRQGFQLVSVNPSDAPPSMTSPSQQKMMVAMATQQAGSGQLCRCGSTELNLVCCCRKSILKEVEVTKVEPCFRECRCQEQDDLRNNRKKRERKVKHCEDKEAKAEEKRRKREERECKKRERAQQKAERRKSKSKAKKSKRKGDKNQECGTCTCCTCCEDEGETILAQPDPCGYPEDRCKKKPKKEKKPREKKEKKKRKKSIEDPCECTSPVQPGIMKIHQDQVQSPSALGFCNHPDIPCPGFGNRDTDQLRVQSRKSVMITQSNGNYCEDPVCTNTKRNKQVEITRNNSCDSPTSFQSCSCAMMTDGCGTDVCNYVAIVDEQPNVAYPATVNIRASSHNRHLKTSQNFPTTSSMNADKMRYRDTTAAPALIFPNEVGHGDTAEALPHSGRPPNDPRSTHLPSGFSTSDNVLIDLSKSGRENSTNKRYVPPCVLYLDCSKVKDLCVIIKDKYEDPS